MTKCLHVLLNAIRDRKVKKPLFFAGLFSYLGKTTDPLEMVFMPYIQFPKCFWIYIKSQLISVILIYKKL